MNSWQNKYMIINEQSIKTTNKIIYIIKIRHTSKNPKYYHSNSLKTLQLRTSKRNEFPSSIRL